MADLYNLLDNLTESQVPQDQNNDDGRRNTVEVAQEEEPQVPLALLEAKRQQQEEHFEEKELTTKVQKLDDEEGTPLLEDPDYAQLKRLWTQEMTCPDLLPHDAETTELQMELLEGQEDSIQKLLSQSSSSDSSTNLNSLMASIYKMDADRVRFMLTDLQRTRLAKIEEHPLHMRDMVDRMSANEVDYLKQYGELLERHFRRTVLDHIPKDAWKKLDEPNMIDTPNLDQFVFCRVLDETVSIDYYDPMAPRDDDDDDGGGGNPGDDVQEHQQGTCLIARYSAIRQLVLEGKIELLL